MKKRVIARLDVKGPNVIKGIQFECLRVMGRPDNLAREYFRQGADELIYLDTVASLYRRDNLLNIVRQASENIFIPFTVGGGVRSIQDIRFLLSAGAEKVAINTAATKKPELIRQAAKTFGSQCIVLSIEAKRISPGRWEAYTDNGRNKTGLDVVKWARMAERLGAGEILLTSVDMEGTERGFENDLIKAVTDVVAIPVIASGGAGSPQDVANCFIQSGADAVAIGSILHYGKNEIGEIKKEISRHGMPVRIPDFSKQTATRKPKPVDLANYNRFTINHLSGDLGLSAENIGNSNRGVNFQDDYPRGRADIGIIDYKINNVRSVLRAFQKLGKKVSIINKPIDIKNVRALVLPGVGSFGEGMIALRKGGFVEPIRAFAKNGNPVLGLCLGMQMLFSESMEFGRHKGLDLVKGKVVSFKPVDKVKNPDYKLPHIGWTDVEISRVMKKEMILSGVKLPASMYFVHSFYPVPEKSLSSLAHSVYGGQKFCSVVQEGNIMGTQFHPEKSGNAGLEILKRFCEISKI